MAAELENAGDWIGNGLKAIGAIVTALFAWIWHTSHRQARIEDSIKNVERRVRRVERGVGKIVNHLTGVPLADTDGEED